MPSLGSALSEGYRCEHEFWHSETRVSFFSRFFCSRTRSFSRLTALLPARALCLERCNYSTLYLICLCYRRTLTLHRDPSASPQFERGRCQERTAFLHTMVVYSGRAVFGQRVWWRLEEQQVYGYVETVQLRTLQVAVALHFLTLANPPLTKTTGPCHARQQPPSIAGARTPLPPTQSPGRVPILLRPRPPWKTAPWAGKHDVRL